MLLCYHLHDFNIYGSWKDNLRSNFSQAGKNSQESLYFAMLENYMKRQKSCRVLFGPQPSHLGICYEEIHTHINKEMSLEQ